MNNNIKILAGALIGAVSVASIGASFANETATNSTGFFNKKFERQELTTEQKTEMEAMRTIFEKQKNGETLTSLEQTKLDEFEANKPEMGKNGKGMGKGFDKLGKGGFMNNLTAEEKTALESMTNDEKKAFFEAKKLEMQAKRESHENVIDKLLAGENLTANEETIRAEIIKERAERKAKMQENID